MVYYYMIDFIDKVVFDEIVKVGYGKVYDVIK